MKNLRPVIDREIEAIELGLVSLAYGLRHTAQVARELNSTAGHRGISAEARATCSRLCREDLREIRRARRIIARLMESVGDFRNNGDMCTDNEEAITWPAYNAMHDLAKSKTAKAQ